MKTEPTDTGTISAAPSAGALRAINALQNENGRRLIAREEFATQEELAAIIDRETALPELIAALRELADASMDFRLHVTAHKRLVAADEVAREALAKGEGRA